MSRATSLARFFLALALSSPCSISSCRLHCRPKPHLHQQISARVEVWRADSYAFPKYHAIAEILDWAHVPETGHSRFLRRPQLGYCHSKMEGLESRPPAIPDDLHRYGHGHSGPIERNQGLRRRSRDAKAMNFVMDCDHVEVPHCGFTLEITICDFKDQWDV